jgi:hypothetical protein
MRLGELVERGEARIWRMTPQAVELIGHPPESPNE